MVCLYINLGNHIFTILSLVAGRSNISLFISPISVVTFSLKKTSETDIQVLDVLLPLTLSPILTVQH